MPCPKYGSYMVGGTVTSVAGTVLLIIFSRVYFQRRADMFVN